MAENLPIKHSLSEAIHNSSISKIDVQSQHPTYPLEDIDQERLFEIKIQTITRLNSEEKFLLLGIPPNYNQCQNRPGFKPGRTSTKPDRITPKLTISHESD